MRGSVIALLLLAACDAWSLSINSDGFIHITVVGGDAYRPRDGYRIRVTRGGESYVVALPSTGELRVEGAAGDPVTLALLPPEGCTVVESPAPVTLRGGDASRARFALACGSLGG